MLFELFNDGTTTVGLLVKDYGLQTSAIEQIGHFKLGEIILPMHDKYFIAQRQRLRWFRRVCFVFKLIVVIGL